MTDLHASSLPPPFRSLDKATQYPVVIVAAHHVRFMKDVLAAQPDGGIMATFGVSAATWRKIRQHEPIRRSTAERLIARVLQMAGPAGN